MSDLAPHLGVGAMTGISAVHANVLDLIGNTPIVDVSNLSPNPNVRILAKLEMQNPFGSVKDRIAKAMIEAAEADGQLYPGPDDRRAVVGQHRHRARPRSPGSRATRSRSCFPRACRSSAARCSRSWVPRSSSRPGPKVRTVRSSGHSQLAEEHPEWCFVYQYGNEANPRAHYEGTGPEIWRDVPEITHFVAGLGTSGTLMGTGTFLKEQNPDIQIIAVEPPLGERVEGLRNMDEGYIPPVFEMWNGHELLDRKRVVRHASRSSGRVVSSTSAACSPASRRVPRSPAPPRSQRRSTAGPSSFIVCDGGWKYLSTGAYTADLDEAERNAESDHLLLNGPLIWRRRPGRLTVRSRPWRST